ncbi:MAG: alpha/beta hydrolase [Phycisphaeraceae bacterium]|nr:alpha/beta hydrolase [Phycisphaeraceae bacterium]
MNMLPVSCWLIALVLVVVPLSGCLAAPAVDPATLPDQRQLKLYPGDPPGEPNWEKDGPVPEMQVGPGTRVRFVHEPVLDVYHAKGENRTGAAVVICPGGGYGMLAYDHEGHEIARWLNDNGITGVILRYRMFPYRHPVPMMDVQRALQTVRASAEKWALDADRIGVLGFSAGGHLASTAATHFAKADTKSADPVERVSSRPNFAVLVYPVVTMRGWTHGGSKRNLLGKEPSDELVALMSNEEQVDANTPPTFLVHSKDDKAVPIKNSEAFLAALNKHNVPGELMVFEAGGHGYGLGRGRNDADKTHETDAWPRRCIEWFGEQGVLD